MFACATVCDFTFEVNIECDDRGDDDNDRPKSTAASEYVAAATKKWEGKVCLGLFHGHVSFVFAFHAALMLFQGGDRIFFIPHNS